MTEALHKAKKKMSPIIEVLLRQIYFTGVEAFPIIIFSGLLIGLIIVLQIMSITGTGSSSIIGKILLVIVLKEIGPLFTGLIILTRSGSAIVTELATMKLGREIYYIEAMGIKPEVYLLKPRLYGVTFSALVLCVYFQLAALFGGVFIASFLMGVSFSENMNALFDQFYLKDVAIAFLKSLLFGFAICLICIWHGISVKKSPTEIPQRTTKALTGGIFFLFLIDVIIDFITKMI